MSLFIEWHWITINIINSPYTNYKYLKPFIRENKSKKIDAELAKEINKIKVKNKNARVKPGYKKKLKAEIDKVKRKHKRQIIKKSIEEQRKKSYKPGGKNYHE